MSRLRPVTSPLYPLWATVKSMARLVRIALGALGILVYTLLRAVRSLQSVKARKRARARTGADREHRHAERRREVSRPEDERLERAGRRCDPPHLDEPARRLDLHLEANALREKIREGSDVGGGIHLRHDDDVSLRRERRLEIVPPPLCRESVDPDGKGATRTRGGEVRARGLLVLDRHAVFQVDDDLVRRQRCRLRDHPRVGRRHGEARAARPCGHGRTLLEGGHLTSIAPMKGVILAGGSGTRLHPLTRITNKHLLPLYDRPMVTYAVEALVRAGIDELMLVTGGTHAGEFFRLLGNGHDYGIDRLAYGYQEQAGGIAEALGLSERV